MADDTPTTDSNSHLLRWLILVLVTVAGIAAARRAALARTDAEFEARLRAADERRDG